MADAKARRAAIEKASKQVRTGNAFVRRASNTQGSWKPTKSAHETKKEAR